MEHVNRFPKGLCISENGFEVFCAQTALRSSAYAQELEDI